MEFKTGLLAIKNTCLKSSPEDSCVSCPLHANCFLDKAPCAWTEQDIKKCAEVAQECIENLPSLTYLELIKKLLPTIRLNTDGIPSSCVSSIFNQTCPNRAFVNDTYCKDCWNSTVPLDVKLQYIRAWEN